jgi:hypothetical protein
MAARAKWTNADGLDVYFGRRKAENEVPSSLGAPALGKKVIEFTFRGEDVVDDPTTLGVEQRGVIIPAGARIASATLYVSEAFASAGAAALDLGLFRLDTGAAFDDDGVDSAIASGGLSVGTVVTCDGAEIGKVQSVSVRIAPSYDAAAYTAGNARLQVTYEEPLVQTA